MQAALASYPQLGCTGGPYEVWTKWGISENVLCAGNPETLQFLDDVFDEIIQLFPSPYIHIGGDECPKIRWEHCPKCQSLMQKQGIKSDSKYTKEQYLQSFIMKHVTEYLKKKVEKQLDGTKYWKEMPILKLQSCPGEEKQAELKQPSRDTMLL